MLEQSLTGDWVSTHHSLCHPITPFSIRVAKERGEGNGLANPTVVGGGRAGAGRVHFSRTPGRINLMDGYQEHTGRKQLGKRLVESAQLCNFTIVMLRLELREVKAKA